MVAVTTFCPSTTTITHVPPTPRTISTNDYATPISSGASSSDDALAGADALAAATSPSQPNNDYNSDDTLPSLQHSTAPPTELHTAHPLPAIVQSEMALLGLVPLAVFMP